MGNFTYVELMGVGQVCASIHTSILQFELKEQQTHICLESSMWSKI